MPYVLKLSRKQVPGRPKVIQSVALSPDMYPTFKDVVDAIDEAVFHDGTVTLLTVANECFDLDVAKYQAIAITEVKR